MGNIQEKLNKSAFANKVDGIVDKILWLERSAKKYERLQRSDRGVNETNTYISGGFCLPRRIRNWFLMAASRPTKRSAWKCTPTTTQFFPV